QQHVVVLTRRDRRRTVVEIVQNEGVERHTGAEREFVDAGDAALLAPLQHRADISAGAAEIENARARRHELDRRGVRTLVLELWFVMRVRTRRGRAVESSIVEQPQLLRTREQYRSGHVPRVLHAVDPADLVAVIGWNRQLLDAQLRDEQL